jgi:hypothetical protein
MFEANNRRESSVTLCFFPHLGEFIAVDARKTLPDGPAVHVLSLENIFTDEFRSSVESGFAALLSKEGAGLMDMIGLPQEVESLVRVESMKRVIKNLNDAAGVPEAAMDGGISVLFFARALLSVGQEQLEAAMQDLFGDLLTDSQMIRLHRELDRLISGERETEGRVRHREMAQLITGEAGQFLTLWQSDAGK